MAVCPSLRSAPRLLFRCEEDRRLRAVLVGMLREGERQSRRSPFRSCVTANTAMTAISAVDSPRDGARLDLPPV